MTGFNWGSYEEEKANLSYCPPAGTYEFELIEWTGTRTSPEKGARAMAVWTWRLVSPDDEKADGYQVKDYTVADDRDPDSCGKFHDTVVAVLGDALNHLDQDALANISERIIASDVAAFDDAIGRRLRWSTKQEDFNGRKQLRLSRPILED